MVLDNVLIGQRIQNIRKINKMTQSQFSERLHMTQQTLSRYENAITPVPYEVSDRISVEFKVPIGYFLGIKSEAVSEEEMLLVEYYRRMDQSVRERVFDLVRAFAEELMMHGDERFREPID